MSTDRTLHSHRLLAAACLVLALGAAAAAFIGVTARSGASSASAVTLRGENLEWITSGPYAHNPVRVVAEGVGWDWVTLVLACPALAVSAWFTARGSLRGRLAAGGLTAYLFYQYLQYSTVWALGPLFPAFVVLFAGALWTLVPLTASSFRGLAGRPWPSAFPRRSLAVLGFSLGAVLLLLWVPRIAGVLASDGLGLLGQTTLVVQALDLGLVLPFCVLTAVLALGRSPWALVLGPVLAVKGLAMALAIAAMLLTAWGVEGRLEAVPLAVFAAAGLGCAAVGLAVFRALK